VPLAHGAIIPASGTCRQVRNRRTLALTHNLGANPAGP
jgi:hypothetical protein